MRPRWRDEDGSIVPEHTIEGFEAVERDGMKLDRITLREPKGIHVRRAESELKSGTPEQVRAYQIRLVAEVSGTKVTVVDLLPISVINEASSYLQAFVVAGLEAGEN